MVDIIDKFRFQNICPNYDYDYIINYTQYNTMIIIISLNPPYLTIRLCIILTPDPEMSVDQLYKKLRESGKNQNTGQNLDSLYELYESRERTCEDEMIEFIELKKKSRVEELQTPKGIQKEIMFKGQKAMMIEQTNINFNRTIQQMKNHKAAYQVKFQGRISLCFG